MSSVDSIVVTENHYGLAVDTERFAAKEIAIFYGWWQAEFGTITLTENGGRYIEEFTIDCLDNGDQPKQEKLFFDITAGYKNVGKSLEQVKSSKELEQIYNDTYFSSGDMKLPKFYGALSFARTLGQGERLNNTSLMDILGIDWAHAESILNALQDCGLTTD